MAENFWSPVKLSLGVATVSLIIVLVVGILLARLMYKRDFTGKIIVETFFVLPLVLPPTVIGFLLIIIFGVNSPIGQFVETIFNGQIMFTWWAAVIASTVVAFPLMYQSSKTSFMSVDKDIEEAAKIDGATEWRIFLFITLPLAYKGIISGAILSFARALGEFGATLMFAGNLPGKTQTMPTAIYVALESGNMELAWMWVLTTIIISFIMLLIVSTIK